MSTRTPITSQPILSVEDNAEDYEATVRSFRKSGVANAIYRCEDGDVALSFLRRRSPFRPPDLRRYGQFAGPVSL